MSNIAGKDGGSARPSSAGAYSLAEILSQPQCWADCLKDLAANGEIGEIERRFGKHSEWIFIGCGSSYYVAQAAAASWAAITRTRARAIPASELLLFPDLVLASTRDFVPVLISRSGYTSEVLRAAQFLSEKKIASIAISCTPQQQLRNLATISILLPRADEQSTVMTRSFTSMLLGLQYLAASLAGKAEFIRELNALPASADDLVQNLPARVREFVNLNRFSDYICLGQGPYYGLACESALKITEMSCSYAQSFHTLEFRHGPKSVVSADTLITFLISESSYDDEVSVLEEIKELGGTTLAIANRIDARARASADFVVELGCSSSQYSCLVPFVIPGQLLGLYTALHKGLDPDNPRNLSRVVVLKDEKQPENAAI